VKHPWHVRVRRWWRLQSRHVYDGEAFLDETGEIGKRRLNEFLEPLGLFFFEVAFEADHLKHLGSSPIPMIR
jgi:hypothetical protein